MANIVESETWDTGVYQLETTDPVQGGVDGIDNVPHKALANRTVWLKAQLALKALVGGSATQIFKAAAGVASDDVVNKGQLDSSISALGDVLSNDGTSLLTNGYTKLSNGLIIQWGMMPGADSSITFPLAFPNEILQAFSTTYNDNDASAITNRSTTGLTITTIDASSGANSSVDASWLAIGY